MKTLRLKRINDFQTEPIFLILEDGTKLKYGEDDFFDKFKKDEVFCLELFGNNKIMTRSVKKIVKDPFQNEDGVWVIVYDNVDTKHN